MKKRDTWWLTRPKRDLDLVPLILKNVVSQHLDEPWVANRKAHLAVEDQLEGSCLKAEGPRRDQSGSGARTYMGWLYSLGLLFYDEHDGMKLRLTLAGEDIINDKSPVKALREQVYKYQFPSAYTSKGSAFVPPRFAVRPVIFVLQLLQHPDLGGFITEDEIAYFALTHGETHNSVDRVARMIADARADSSLLPSDALYQANWGTSFSNAHDVANTLKCWLDLTDLIERGEERGSFRIKAEKQAEALAVVESYSPQNNPLLTFKPKDSAENFQRKYGRSPGRTRDTRSFGGTSLSGEKKAELCIVANYGLLFDQRLLPSFGEEELALMTARTGMSAEEVTRWVTKLFPKGNSDAFLLRYRRMAFSSRDQARDFEIATSDIFHQVFGFESKQIGQTGRKPDVIVRSEACGYQGIIDTKAYTSYSVSSSNEHSMIYEYIPKVAKYSPWGALPLAFFLYVAGGFKSTINKGIQTICTSTGTNGSAITVDVLIAMIQKQLESQHFSHQDLRQLFALNREILVTDF